MAVSGDRNKDRLLCHCLTVTWGEVEEAIRTHGCRKVSQVTGLCGAGGGCKSCHPEIEELIRVTRAESGGGLLRRVGRLLSGKGTS